MKYSSIIRLIFAALCAFNYNVVVSQSLPDMGVVAENDKQFYMFVDSTSSKFSIGDTVVYSYNRYIDNKYVLYIKYSTCNQELKQLPKDFNPNLFMNNKCFLLKDEFKYEFWFESSEESKLAYYLEYYFGTTKMFNPLFGLKYYTGMKFYKRSPLKKNVMQNKGIFVNWDENVLIYESKTYQLEGYVSLNFEFKGNSYTAVYLPCLDKSSYGYEFFMLLDSKFNVTRLFVPSNA